VRFLAETVPAYGAVTTFKMLHDQYPDYTYREATLNPTNPQDRASDWEADIIRELGNHPEKKEIVNERQTPDGPSLYIASPIIPKESCLECHSVPSAAPRAMIAVYGPDNGFGWKAGSVVGAQIVSVPSSVPIAIADKAFHALLLYLAITLIVAILALDAGVYLLVLRPIQLVAHTADSVSRGEANVPELVVASKDEIGALTASFNRMRVSLAKALAMLDE
jgi:protein-histidine pros-kinase